MVSAIERFHCSHNRLRKNVNLGCRLIKITVWVKTPDSAYNFKTTDWKDKPINICNSKIQFYSVAISAKKTDFSETILSSFKLIKFMGQVQKRRSKIKVIIWMYFVTYVTRLQIKTGGRINLQNESTLDSSKRCI